MRTLSVEDEARPRTTVALSFTIVFYSVYNVAGNGKEHKKIKTYEVLVQDNIFVLHLVLDLKTTHEKQAHMLRTQTHTHTIPA